VRAQQLPSWLVTACLLWGTVVGAPLAHAQLAPRDPFRLDRYNAQPTTRDGFALTLPMPLLHLQASAQAMAHYDLSPLVVRVPGERTVVRSRVTLEVVAALGLFNILEVYARVPTVVYSAGHDTKFDLTSLNAPNEPALSDMAVGVAGGRTFEHGLSFGGKLEAILPTGSSESLTTDHRVEPRAEVLAAYQRSRLTLSGMLGGILRDNADYTDSSIGPELTWGLGMRVRLHDSVEASLEIAGVREFRNRASESASDGAELFLGGRKRMRFEHMEVALGGAVSAGLSDLIGEPAFRGLFNAGVTQRPGKNRAATQKPGDRDGDGLDDVHDQCIDEPEDHDGHADDDGCLDPDNDSDGVNDALDACPNEAGGGRDGCPTLDIDGDGIADTQDQCPRDPEDIDGDRDADGCPDLDSDGDGLTDDRDACPDVPGVAAKNGCLVHARLERDTVATLTPITFDTQTVSVASTSLPVLDDVAALLLARSQLQAMLLVKIARRPVPDGGLVTGRARVALLLEALVARNVPRTRLSSQIELVPANQHDDVVIMVRAAPP
jgi:OOP family OmpA-OmpF porin